MTRKAAASSTSKTTAPAALHIFRPGKHVAMGGQTLSFSEADLAATVAAYDPAKHEAPLVVGHPQHDLPAYGWVQSLAFADGGLDAVPAQVNADFAEMVANGAFKKISASFYTPDAPQNPVPGCYYLRHVGFLGAQPPAIKGLRQAQFAEAEEGVVAFGEYDDMTNAGLWRNLREWMLAKFGTDEADRALPNFEVRALELGAQDDLRAAAVAQAKGEADALNPINPLSPAYAERPPVSTTPEKRPMDHEQILADITAENTRLKAELAAQKTAQVHAAHTAFCEAVPGLAPAHVPTAVAMLDQLSAQDTPVNFGEGEDARPLADKFKEMLTALPPVVSFGETATGKRAAGEQGAGSVSFAAPTGYTVDKAKLAELGRAKAYAALHKVDLVSAVTAVQAGQA